MPVPRMTQLRPGIAVNIVLKAHQSTGKLTRGQIAYILTRRDHPRGIKVRLTDGQVGRVQSLSDNGFSMPIPPTSDRESAAIDSYPKNIERRQRRAMQEDYRLDPAPADATSLFDYVKPAKKKKKENIGLVKAESAAVTQEMLQEEFPMFDSALIAAILSDHDDDGVAARSTLKSLAGE